MIQHGIGEEAGGGMGRAPAVGDRGARKDTGGGETIDEAGQHARFAAMQVIGAGRVDNETVGRSGATIGA
jgi:hypothetical protein